MPVIRGSVLERDGQLVSELVTVRHTIRVCAEPGVGCPLRVIDDVAQGAELLVIPYGDHHGSVGRRVHLVRRDRWMGVPHEPRNNAGAENRRGLIHECAEGAAEEVDLDMLATTRGIAFVKCGEDRDARVETGDHVHHRDSDLGGLVDPGDAHQSAGRLHQEVVPRHACSGA